jgi:hypothetical protein
MEGLRRVALMALIIALALVLLVCLGFAAYSIFLAAKLLVRLVWHAHPPLGGLVGQSWASWPPQRHSSPLQGHLNCLLVS